MRFGRFFVLLALLVLAIQPVIAQWEFIGPEGGEVVSLAGDDSLTACIVLGSILGSHDGGISWARLAFPTSNYHDIMVNGSRITAATPEGILISSDRGTSWKHATMPSAEDVSSLCLSQGVLFASTVTGMVRSFDQGATWQSLPSADSVANSRAICGFSTTFLNTTMNSLFATGEGGGLWRSTDLGFSWVRADAGIPHMQVNALHAFTFSLLVGGKVQIRGWLYAGTKDSSVWASSDHGASWRKLARGLENCSVHSLLTTGGIFGDTLLAGTMDGLFMYVAGDSLWRHLTSDLPPCDIASLHIAPAGILAGTSEGVFRSVDGGLRWMRSSQGMGGRGHGGPLAANATTLFSGYYSPLRRPLTGGSWSLMNAGRDHYGYFEDVDAGWGSRVHYVSSFDSVYWQSTDNGDSWKAGGKEVNARWYSIAHNVTRSRLYGGTTNGVMVSTNNGTSWTQAGAASIPKGIVRRVRTNTTGPVTTVFAGVDSAVYYSENDGSTWVRRTVPHDSTDRYPHVRDIVVAGSRWFVLNGEGYSSLSRSTDQGVHWEVMHPRFNVNAIHYIAPHLFAAGIENSSTPFPLAVSDDYGTTWRRVPSPGPILLPLTLASSGDTLYASTGWGILKASITQLLASTDVRSFEVPVGFGLEQNYPNPFNPATTIRYGLPARAYVQLTAYNTLGQRIAVLVEGEQDAGAHEVRFDASNLPSGVYFYRLQAGGQTATKRLLLLK